MSTFSYARSVVKPPPISALLTDLKRKTRSELAGPCWRCGGRDRFIVSGLSGRGFCRQCEWKGDSIQLLRDRDGLSFREAVLQLGCETIPGPAVEKVSAEQRAIEEVKAQYRSWQSEQLDTLFAEFRDLDAAREIALTAYRQMLRRPDLYTAAERTFWTRTVGRCYDRLAVLTQTLDFLTGSDYEPARFARWEEVSDAQ